MEKKTIYIGGGVLLGVLILLLLVVWLLSVLTPHYYDYYEAEELISSKTKSYMKQNPSELPSSDGRHSFDYETLVEADYIKPLNKILRDGDECSAQIYIDKNGAAYSYSTKLSCGDNYQTTEFYKQFLKDHQTVTSESGLYSDTKGGYYLRGKINNNYVVFGSRVVKKEKVNLLWRVISIDSNNNIKLRATFPTTASTKWDDRYNEEDRSSNGYNDFETSVIKDFLKELETNDEVLSESYRGKLVPKQLCIAPREKKDATMDGSVECSTMSKDTYLFGTITPYEYMRASLDEKCNALGNRSCSNFNFIAGVQDEDEWTLTAVPGTNNEAYTFTGRLFSTDRCRGKKSIYVTVTLNQYVYYRSGSGTEADPYVIK